jgi:hypothetical protein
LNQRKITLKKKRKRKRKSAKQNKKQNKTKKVRKRKKEKKKMSGEYSALEAANEYASKNHTRDQFLIGVGIVTVSGLIGFTYGVFKNNKNSKNLQSNGASKSLIDASLKSDIMSGAEGALIGLVIAAIAIVAMNLLYHWQRSSHVYAVRSAANDIQQKKLAQMASGGLPTTGATTAARKGAATPTATKTKV